MRERKRPTCKVKARKERERAFIPSIPYYKVANGEVDFGSKVHLLSLFDQEEHYVKVKTYGEQMDMPPIQKLIIHKRVGEIVSFGKYYYKILNIS